MPGVEAAVVAAGKAVAERAMREWLAARGARKERGAELKDLIQSSFRDRLAPRKFDNQLQGMALAVEGRLSVLVEHEFRGLGDGDRAAVLHEVVRTLQAADLSDAALFDADADPAKLAERLIAAQPSPALGEAEERLYGVLLAECVECVVGMAQQLPQYLPRAATESLSRLTGLAEGMERLLARMPVRTLEAPEGRQDDAAFERGYLAFLSRSLDEVELFGVRVESFRPRTSLSVAYISLSVSADDGRGRQPLDRMPVASLSAQADPEPGSLRVESVLGRSRLTLLRGEAGSGKSTLLRWLAVTAARGGFTGDLAEWNGCVPLMIKLRSHADGRFPPPEAFLDDVAQEVAGRMPRGWVERVLDSGRALVLVDGVDELAVRHRPAVRHGLARLLAAYPGLRVVVTSRPTAADAKWLADEGFAAALLEPMVPEDLRELVRQWHLAMRDCPSLPCAPEELEGYEGGLLARLESNPHLRMLGSTPLLAAMLCALNLDRRTQLPRSRMGLYDAVLALLLERRDAERGIGDDLALDPEQKVWILRELAWRLVSMGRSELSKATAIRRVEQKLPSMTRMPYTAPEVLEHLLRRSGVLREPVPGRIDFAHRTVQEYLAAGQLIEDEDVEIAVERAHLDQWREVVVMAAGHANARLRRELLAGLLDRAEQGGKYARRLRLLVASCLETIQEVPVELRDRIEACLASVIPPRTEDEAAILAGAGEEILRRLPDDLSGLSASRAALVVRTAWLINGSSAMDKLARYGRDERYAVWHHLFQGWDYFEPAEYAQRVLANADGSTAVTLFHTQRLPHLRHLPRLESLGVYPDDRITDLGFLRGLPGLRRLTLEDLDVDEIAEVGRLLQLERLELTALTVRPLDIRPLTGLPRLDALILKDFTIELPILDELPRLDELAVGLSPGQDLAPVTRQTRVTDLSLYGAGQRIDPAVLTPLAQVQCLQLRGLELAEGFRPVAQMWPSIGLLVLEAISNLSDLEPLRNLGLTYLTLSECPGISTLEALRDVRQLESLILRNLPVTDLTPLAGLVDLESLTLRGCAGITDLSPLAGLHKLTDLELSDIAADLDLAPLAGRPGVRIIATVDQRFANEHLLHRNATILRVRSGS